MPEPEGSGQNLLLEDTDIVVVVVNWNTKELLRQCLDSLRACRESLRLSVVVVDNGSTDGSADMIEAAYPETRLVKNPMNMGFAKANNVVFGLYPACSYFLLLNSDATVTPEVIRTLLRFLKAHDDVGAVGPALRLPNGQFQMGGAGWGPRASCSFNTFFLLSRMNRRFRGLFIVQEHYEGRREPVEVDWLAGACMMIRTKTLAQVGFFDERYFVYGEDAEWCWRARAKGWRLAYLPQVFATHHYRGSMVESSSMRAEWFDLLADAVCRSSSAFNYRSFLLFGVMGYALRVVGLVPLSIGRKRSSVRDRIANYRSLLGESTRLLFRAGKECNK